MRVQNEANVNDIRHNYGAIKSKLLSIANFPETNKILNLPQFVKENQNLYAKLINEAKELKNNNITGDKQSKIKSGFVQIPQVNKSNKSNNDSDKINELKIKNQSLKKTIQKMREQNSKRQQVSPKIVEKQNEIKSKQEQIERLGDLNKRLRCALDNEDMLQLYESMCRQCEHLRKANNETSQLIKQTIVQINKLTGSEENPNLFLMNLKL